MKEVFWKKPVRQIWRKRRKNEIKRGIGNRDRLYDLQWIHRTKNGSSQLIGSPFQKRNNISDDKGRGTDRTSSVSYLEPPYLPISVRPGPTVLSTPFPVDSVKQTSPPPVLSKGPSPFWTLHSQVCPILFSSTIPPVLFVFPVVLVSVPPFFVVPCTLTCVEPNNLNFHVRPLPAFCSDLFIRPRSNVSRHRSARYRPPKLTFIRVHTELDEKFIK